MQANGYFFHIHRYKLDLLAIFYTVLGKYVCEVCVDLQPIFLKEIGDNWVFFLFLTIFFNTFLGEVVPGPNFIGLLSTKIC